VADGDLHASVAPFQRYYLCIDGTGAQDSVEYGQLLQEMFGWRNLLSEFLKPDPAGEKRLIDPNHPFLSVCTFPARKGKPIAVVSPGGRDGQGLDAFWQTYKGETDDEKANQGRHVFEIDDNVKIETVGRQTAASKSALFMRDLILSPAIEKVTDDQGRPAAQIKDVLPGNRKPTEPDVPAELLIISSHGWLGGYMHGESLLRSPAAQPDKAKDSFNVPFVYFLVGLALAEGKFFVGPKWLILAQCSTINMATWLSWARLMVGGIPPVRGILGYEEVSPGVTGSIQIAKAFFDKLNAGQSLLKAWRAANKNEKWAALVHKQALNDTMTGWAELDDETHRLTELDLAEKKTSYLAFGVSVERGKDPPKDGGDLIDIPAQNVFNVPPPFDVRIETSPAPGRPFQEVTEATLNRAHAHLFEETQVRMTITPPANATIASATVRWVHMRETHTVQPRVDQIFSSFTPVPDGSLRLTVSTKDPRTPNTVIVEPAAGPIDKMVILWVSQTEAVLERSGMELTHSFIWPLVTINIIGGEKPSLTFPFSTRGLLR
jgi:hypothetical protein